MRFDCYKDSFIDSYIINNLLTSFSFEHKKHYILPTRIRFGKILFAVVFFYFSIETKSMKSDTHLGRLSTTLRSQFFFWF